jgi:phenylacetate-CoA ligase
MSVGIRRPHQAVDYDDLVAQFQPAPEYFADGWLKSPEEIERVQLQRLKERAMAARHVPFFAKRWAEAKFDPRELRTLEDLWAAPFYTVDDIRKSIDEHPPWGDYQGVTPDRALTEPMRIWMSGGTTGKSRPTFYTHWDREAGAILTARALYMQGIRPGDVVLNAWAYGTHNGAFCFDEALHRWLNCIVITTGTGNVTSSEKQVELAIQYGATAILTTGDYLLRLSQVAQEMGYSPTDLKIRALPNIGDREVLESTFGAECYNSYGFHEVQWVSVECPAHDGLHIFEDAFVVQIVDPETGERLPDGELGSICITELYKTGSPQFRYNIMDLSYLYPREQCSCGSWLRKMAPFAGRGDNMIKLRGINVWPEGVFEIAKDVPGTTDDWFARAVRVENRDELIFHIVGDESAKEAVEARLRDRLGVKIQVEMARPGELDAWTEVGVAAKLKRFRDDR